MIVDPKAQLSYLQSLLDNSLFGPDCWSQEQIVYRETVRSQICGLKRKI